jgi:ribose transport system substrate-binding protein
MYGTIRMHQEREYPGRISATQLKNPDFKAYAQAFGGHGERVERTEDFAPALARARAAGTMVVFDPNLRPRRWPDAAAMRAGIEAAVHAAKAAGVIVVAVDANANGPVDTFVGSKNRDAGYLSCKYLGDALGGKGEVAILDGIPVVPILQRVEGCKAALAEFPEIQLVDTQNGRQDRSVALGVVENMIQSKPNLAGIFSVNDGGAMGALAAIQGSGKDIKLVSVDGAPEAVKAIAEGGPFIETTAQFPRDQVRVGLAMALAQKWGARVVPKEVPIDVMVVDAKNAAEFRW